MTEQDTARSARSLAVLIASKRRLQTEMKELQARINEMEEEVIAGLVDNGIARITVATERDGDWTISASTLEWARIKDSAKPMLPGVLASHGLMELLTVNSTKLSGLYREHCENVAEGTGEGLPSELVDMLEVTERTRVNARRM